MKLTAPSFPIWLIGVVLGALGILGHFVVIPVVTVNQFWFVSAGFVVLAVATLLKGL